VCVCVCVCVCVIPLYGYIAISVPLAESPSCDCGQRQTTNNVPINKTSQLRRHASSAIAMFPGLSHSSLAYYAAVAVPLQTNTLSTITAAAAD